MVTLLTLATLPPGTAKQHHPLSTVSPVSKVLPIQRDVTGRDGLSAESSLSPAVETAICATRAGRCSGMSRTWSRSRVIRTQCDKDSRAGGQATNWAGDARHWSIRNPNDAVHVLSSRAVNDTMPQPPITAMHRPRATAVGRAAKLLYWGTPTAGMARSFQRPRSTVKAWIAGRRRPSVEDLRRLHRLVRTIVALAADVAAELEGDILLREREPKRRRGFLEVRERDGRGSEPRGERWRG